MGWLEPLFYKLVSRGPDGPGKGTERVAPLVSKDIQRWKKKKKKAPIAIFWRKKDVC